MPEMIARATDLNAPVRTMTIDGVTYKLVFSNAAARYAEDVYFDQYHIQDAAKCNYMNILKEATSLRLRAMQAIYYGALRAGGCMMPWEEFDQKFTYSAIDGFKETLMKALADSLPPKDEQKNPNP